MSTEARRVNLRVHVSGLFLMVRHPRHLSVLAPDTSHGDCPHGGHVHPHSAKVAYAVRHATDCPDICEGEYCLEELAGHRLTLSNGHAPTSVSFGSVFDLGSRRRAKPTFGPELLAEVVLASGHLIGASGGARMRVGAAKVRMPPQLVWQVPNVEPRLVLESLDGASQRVIELEPDGSAQVDLFILHTTEEDLCPVPKTYDPPAAGTVMHHFFALDSLLVPGHAIVEEPVWEGAPGDTPSGSHSAIQAITGANPYTCMPGGTEPGP